MEEQKRTPHGRLRVLEKAASPQAEQRMRRRPLVLRHGRGARGHRGLEPAAQQLRLACLLPRLRAQPPSAEKSAPPIPSVHSSSFPTISRTMPVSPAKWGAVSTTSGPSGRDLPGPPWSERALVPSVGRVSIPSPATAPSRRGLYGSPPAQQRTVSPLSPGDTRERPLAGVRLAGVSPLGSTTTSRAMYAAARREFTAAGASVPELAGRRGKSLGWPQTKAGEGEGAFFGVIDPFFVLVASTDEPVGGIRHSHRGVFDAWHFLWVFSPGASISPFT